MFFFNNHGRFLFEMIKFLLKSQTRIMISLSLLLFNVMKSQRSFLDGIEKTVHKVICKVFAVIDTSRSGFKGFYCHFIFFWDFWIMKTRLQHHKQITQSITSICRIEIFRVVVGIFISKFLHNSINFLTFTR